jgi:hypothetical protein
MSACSSAREKPMATTASTTATSIPIVTSTTNPNYATASTAGQPVAYSGFASVTTFPADSASASPSPTSAPDPNAGRISPGGIAGLVVSILVGLSALLIPQYIGWKRRRKQKAEAISNCTPGCQAVQTPSYPVLETHPQSKSLSVYSREEHTREPSLPTTATLDAVAESDVVALPHPFFYSAELSAACSLKNMSGPSA